MFMQNIAICGDHAHRAVMRNFERGRVAAVFFGLLRHQTNVLHGSCSGRVQRAIGFEKPDGFVVNSGIGTVGDHAICVGFVAIRTPALATCADKCRDRRVNDDVAGHMQVGDATVGIDHIHWRSRCQAGVNCGHDLGTVVHLGHTIQQITQARIRVDPGRIHFVAKLVKDRTQKGAHGMAKDDRVGHLHHCCFQVQRKQDAGLFRSGDLFVKERTKRRGRHEGRVNDSTGRKIDPVFQGGHRSVRSHQINPGWACLCVA